MDLATALALVIVLLTGVGLGCALGVLWARGRTAAGVAQSLTETERRSIEARSADQAVVHQGLEQLQERLHSLDRGRVAWESQLKEQVEDVRRSTESLRRETGVLSTALRKPQVRGQWGELHLRRAVELAGMVSRCDFSEQVSIAAEGGTVRPDLVVNLAGGKHVIVDAKVPLDAFLDATGADSDAERSEALTRHARQLRQHVDALSAKAYWRALPTTPEFVVLFVPGESFLCAALEAEPALLEYAASRSVVLATPTTLIALLRTVSFAWTQEVLAENARDIHELGRELYTRLSNMGGHLDKLGRSLTNAVTSYNRAIGSLETRVLVSARKFTELGLSEEPLPSLAPVTEAARPCTAAELMEAVADVPDPLDEVLAAQSPQRRLGRTREA